MMDILDIGIAIGASKNYTNNVVSVGGTLTNIVRQPDGTLLFTFTPTSSSPIVFNAGVVPQGVGVESATIDTTGVLVLTFDDGSVHNAGVAKGQDGRELRLRMAGTELQMQYEGDVAWNPLYDFGHTELPASILDVVLGAEYFENEVFTDPDTGLIFRAVHDFISQGTDDDLANGDIVQIGGDICKVPAVPQDNIVVGNNGGIEDSGISIKDIANSEDLDGKLDKVTDGNKVQVYAVAANNEQEMITVVANSASPYTIPERNVYGNIAVGSAESDNEAVNLGDVKNLLTTVEDEIQSQIDDIDVEILTTIELPVWNSSTYELVFTAKNSTTLTVDLSKLIDIDIGFDALTNELIIIDADGNEHRVDMSALIPVYEGSIGDNIQITVDDSIIKAILIDGSISAAKLTQALQDEIGKISNLEDDISDIIDELTAKEYVLTEGNNITIDRTNPLAPIISATSASGGDLQANTFVPLDFNDIPEAENNLDLDTKTEAVAVKATQGQTLINFHPAYNPINSIAAIYTTEIKDGYGSQRATIQTRLPDLSNTIGMSDIGTVVRIEHNGNPMNLVVVHKGRPSEDYICPDDVVFVRTQVALFPSRRMNNVNTNNYAESEGFEWANNEFYNGFSDDAKAAIIPIKIPYRDSGIGGIETLHSGDDGLLTKIFHLSGTEAGHASTPAIGVRFSAYGSGTDFASNQTRVVRNSIDTQAVTWWTREPVGVGQYRHYLTGGNMSNNLANASLTTHYFVLVFAIPASTIVTETGDLVFPSASGIQALSDEPYTPIRPFMYYANPIINIERAYTSGIWGEWVEIGGDVGANEDTNPASLISNDTNNVLMLGTDDKLLVLREDADSVKEAPLDGGRYLRQNGQWARAVNVVDDMVVANNRTWSSTNISNRFNQIITSQIINEVFVYDNSNTFELEFVPKGILNVFISNSDGTFSIIFDYIVYEASVTVNESLTAGDNIIIQYLQAEQGIVTVNNAVLENKLDVVRSNRAFVVENGVPESLSYSSDGFFMRMSITGLNQALSMTPWSVLQGRSMSDVTLSANTDLNDWSIGSDGQLIFPDFGERYTSYSVDIRVTGTSSVVGNNSAELVTDLFRQNAQNVASSRGGVLTNAAPNLAMKSMSFDTYVLGSADPFIDGGVQMRLSCGVSATVTQVDIVIKGNIH